MPRVIVRATLVVFVTAPVVACNDSPVQPSHPIPANRVRVASFATVPGATSLVRVDVPAKGNSWMVSAFTDKNIVSATSTLLAERVPAVQAAGIPKGTP